MKETYIITICGSNREFFTNKIYATRDEARIYVLELIMEDRNGDIENFRYGTESVDDFDITNSNGFCGYNDFSYYSINYFAVPYNDIKLYGSHPQTIRIYARLKYNEPIYEDYNVDTDGSLCIEVNGERINIDFEDVSVTIDDDDRSIVHVMWKNPDIQTFAESFDKLTLKTLKSGNIKFVEFDNRNPFYVYYMEGNEYHEQVIEMTLESPYGEFEPIKLV